MLDVDQQKATWNTYDHTIDAFLIALTEEKVEGDISDFLKETETLIVDIPPGLRKNKNENFVKKMKFLFAEVEKSDVKHIVYVSSTSVFEDVENFPVYKESDTPNANSSTAQQLIEVENLWQQSVRFKTSLVRFGGLIGKDRHPVKYLAGRENIESPKGPINLIEQEDAVALLLQLIETSSSGIFHGVYPKHPTRQAYYSAEAIKRGLVPPTFNQAKVSKGKVISTEDTSGRLKFEFKFCH